MRREPSMAEILRFVSEQYGLTERYIKSHRRSRDAVLPRQVFCWFARRYTRNSFPNIGRFLADRDHTTIIYSVQKIDKLLEAGEIRLPEVEWVRVGDVSAPPSPSLAALARMWAGPCAPAPKPPVLPMIVLRKTPPAVPRYRKRMSPHEQEMMAIASLEREDRLKRERAE